MKLNDPHTEFAAQLFNIKPEQVTVEQRQLAKQHMYWRLYSMPRPFITNAKISCK